MNDVLLEAVRRESAMLLDNIGITVEMEKLPSASLRPVLGRVLFGHGRLSRLWCVHLRPWLMPKWQARVEAAWERAGEIARAELLNAVLEKGQPKEGCE